MRPCDEGAIAAAGEAAAGEAWWPAHAQGEIGGPSMMREAFRYQRK
jgi:hypothetical protein